MLLTDPSSTSLVFSSLQVEQLLQLGHGILRACNRVTDCPAILVDLVIVTALVCLVTKEVDSGILLATVVLGLGLEMLKAVGLIPTGWEDVKGDLASNGVAVFVRKKLERWMGGRDVRQAKIRELLLQCRNEGLTDLVLLIIHLILISLPHGCITSNRRNIDHAISILDECASLHWNVKVRNVMQDELDELLVSLLTNKLDKGVCCQRLTELVGCETVLGEAEVEKGGYWDVRCAELLLLFGEVGTANETDGYFVAEEGEELEGLWGDGLLCSSSVNALIMMAQKDRRYGEHTLLAGVKVPSTSNRQMVFLIGRCSSGG